MADKFGLKIGLEGEKEFKQSLADINSAYKINELIGFLQIFALHLCRMIMFN